MTQAAAKLSQRSPQEVFQHHVEALGGEDVDGILMDYAETSRVITPDGVSQGKEAIRKVFDELIATVPKAKWSVKTTFSENILFLLWTADSDPASVSDGVDTFLFKDGMIEVQTVRYTAVPKK
jgi:SnoaL-like protein